jgi:hypothetical protein
MSFVGVTQHLSPEALIQLLEKFDSAETSYYFLRWNHKVSGIWQRHFKEFPSLAEDVCHRLKANQVDKSQPLEAFPSPEGQMFNSQLELRWKKKKANYEILLLSAVGFKEDYPELESVGNNWKVVNRNAHFYASTPTQTETRFPKKFDYEDIKVSQRYFQDKDTATVHFVALTVSNKND